jgi:DNA-binding transcriptional regulator YhcF (GntR family)
MAHSPLDLTLERTSDVPLGTQLAWKLRAAIAAGALRPGDRLPPVRELAATAGVNVNTVRAVYARLSGQGVIDSEHGRGTFVSQGSGAGPDLGELIERTARDARRHDVDPRELAALLYARFDSPAAPVDDAADAGAEVEARRTLRAEIEALEHELAGLEPQFVRRRAGEGDGGAGARLVSARELRATRDALADRVSARRRQLREARVRARSRAAEPVRVKGSQHKPEPAAWPELLASRPARIAPGT